MAHIRFTRNIQRHVACPDEGAEGDTVRACLDSYFTRHPEARLYVLDDHGAVRKHIVVFLNNTQINDREHLSDRATGHAVIDVFQALSGG